MNKQDLNAILEKYIDLKSKYNKIQKLYKLKREYERNEIVKEYLNILNEIEKLREVRSLEENELFRTAIRSVPNKEKSFIYVSIGDEMHYIDIETTEIIKLDNKKEAIEFEENNLVIYPNGEKKGIDFFDYVRENYFKIAIMDGKEKAFEYILKYSKKSNLVLTMSLSNSDKQ